PDNHDACDQIHRREHIRVRQFPMGLKLDTCISFAKTMVFGVGLAHYWYPDKQNRKLTCKAERFEVNPSRR
ncbi:MAG: hypothetical protein WCO56_28165, partial [Verrucomicrobiota bacterium]